FAANTQLWGKREPRQHRDPATSRPRHRPSVQHKLSSRTEIPATGGRSMQVFRALVCLLMVSLSYGLAQASVMVTAIHAGHVIDPDSGRVLDDQTILINGTLVTDIGARVQVPPDARVLDLREYTVLPGLFDAHTHLTIDIKHQDPLYELQHTAAERAFGSIPNARAVLLAGFTTVRDLGSYRALVDVALRDAINRGDVVGPRMYVVGAYVTVTGGAGAVTGFAPDVALRWDLRYGTANSADEVRERVRALAGQRVDLIKMFATGAILTHNSNPSAREATAEQLAAGVDEAHNFGLKVAVHAHGAEGIKA